MIADPPALSSLARSSMSLRRGRDWVCETSPAEFVRVRSFATILYNVAPLSLVGFRPIELLIPNQDPL